MRTYGRVVNEDGSKTWQVVETSPNGDNSAVWLTTLLQVLKLNLNESPFYGSYGIPAHPSVVQQVFPDYYSILTQQEFARYFASLIISKENAVDGNGFPYPRYRVNVVTSYGAQITTYATPPQVPG